MNSTYQVSLGKKGKSMNRIDLNRRIGAGLIAFTVAAVAHAAAVDLPGKAGLAGGFRELVKATQPAVVSITASKTVTAQSGRRSMPGRPFPGDRPSLPEGFGPFGDFFNQPEFEGGMPQERQQRGAGSGVIVRSDGYVLTNDHVVDKADDIKVVLSDKREFKAKLIGTDPKTDIAVLKIDATNLPVLKLGDSSTVEVGDVVLAMGNPFGIGQTVTLGIASAVGRSNLGIEEYEDFIQTDAAINPGNSGGALINTRGELVGINVAILSRSGGNQGIGFAVPSNLAKEVMDQIIDHGKVIRGWLGVSIQPVDATMAAAFGLKEARGALVGGVDPTGPASKAGLKSGDIIVTLNGKPVEDSKALRMAVAMLKPGTTAALGVFRDGAQRDVKVTLGEFPETAAERAQGAQPDEAMRGVAVDSLTPKVAQQLGLPAETQGLVVTSVAPGSAAAEAGLRRGDVIQEVNRKPVTNLEGFRSALSVGKGQPVLLFVNRGGSTLFLMIEGR